MITLRDANNDDCKLLFKWANDEEVRKNSFSSNKIDLETHIKWFESKMNDINYRLFIIMEDEAPVGQIRIDIDSNKYLISYSIDANHRGKGIGSESLKLIKEKFENTIIIGLVKKDNIASIRAFEKAGYYKVESEEYIVFSK